jgi:hypothetical protein
VENSAVLKVVFVKNVSRETVSIGYRVQRLACRKEQLAWPFGSFGDATCSIKSYAGQVKRMRLRPAGWVDAAPVCSWFSYLGLARSGGMFHVEREYRGIVGSG